MTYTGVIPLIYKAQRELLNDLVESFLLAFGVIALVMIVVLRDLRSGLLAMVPNIFPAVVIFGLMGWCSIWIEIGSIMTASAAMGIAVDDTFHLLTWYRRGLRQQHAAPRGPAVRTPALRRRHGPHHADLLLCLARLLAQFLHADPPLRLADGRAVDRRVTGGPDLVARDSGESFGQVRTLPRTIQTWATDDERPNMPG